MTAKIIEYLKKHHLHVSLIESMTGGLAASEFIKIPNASSVLETAFITYSVAAKVQFGVSEEIIQTFGVVSKETALSMADALYLKTKADLCISITGNAGPTLQDDKASLESYICMKFNGDYYQAHLTFNENKRVLNMNLCVEKIKEMLLKILKV